MAREDRVDSAKIRRTYALSTFRRQDQICVKLSSYRDRRGGGLYCYEGLDGPLIEERISGRPFGNRSLGEVLLDAIDRE
jgi:hypothetical protein